MSAQGEHGGRDAAGHLPRRVTAADVAARAGCTASAVSLWINGKTEGRISEGLGLRIQEAVRELGYIPNRTAQRLSTGQSNLLSFVFPDVWYTFFSYILDGITSELDETWDVALNVTLPSERNGDDRGLAMRRALSVNPTGLIVASPTAEALEEIPRNIPTVVVDATHAPAHASLVRYDLESGIEAAADLLFELGHRRVGYLGFDRPAASLIERRELLAAALRRRGIELNPDRLELDSVRHEQIVARVEGWLRPEVTAVVCGDEVLAYGVLEACENRSLSIPRDLSVISFNDLAPARIVNPSLTSITMPPVAMGRLAGRALNALISTNEPRATAVSTELIVRNSTGRAPRS